MWPSCCEPPGPRSSVGGVRGAFPSPSCPPLTNVPDGVGRRSGSTSRPRTKACAAGGDAPDGRECIEMKVHSVVAPGIYRMDNGSYRVVARVGDRKTGPRPKEKRFPADTALRVMRGWQEDQRAE